MAATQAIGSGRDLRRTPKKSSSNFTDDFYHKIKLVSRILFFLVRGVSISFVRQECRAWLSAGGATRINRILRVRSGWLQHPLGTPAQGWWLGLFGYLAVRCRLSAHRCPNHAGRIFGFSAPSPGNRAEQAL